MRPRSAVGTSRGALAALVAAVLAGGAFGLYEEQVGQFEWAKRGVGAPREAVFLKKSVIVGTDKGVLANLGLRNGEINWRHILGSGAWSAASVWRVAHVGGCVRPQATS